MKNYGRNKQLPKAPPIRQHRLSPRTRQSTLQSTRSMIERDDERRFDPRQRGSWKGSSRDLVVNARKKGPQPGYALELTEADAVRYESDRGADGWSRAPAECWTEAIVSESKRTTFVGYRTIDGNKYAVFETLERVPVWWAQLAHYFPHMATPRRRSLKRNGSVSERELDDFLRSYLVTMLWSSNDESDESGGEPLDANYSIDDIAEKSLQEQRAICEEFLSKYGDLIESADCKRGGEWSKIEQAGHDFWLNRNGHGAGFWDGDWGEPEADQLSEGSEEFGEAHPYVGDDGKVYVDDSYLIRRKMKANPDAGDMPYDMRSLTIDFRHRDPPEHNGQRISYGSFDRGEANEGEPQWYEVAGAGGSDYSGGSVYQSNYRVLKEMLEEAHPHDSQPVVWADSYGGHGTYALLVVWDLLDESIREAIGGIESYPLISDDDHSQLEVEMQEEAWSDWGRRDFEKAFLKSLNAELDESSELDDLPDEFSASDMFTIGCNVGNHYWEDQDGSGMWIDMDKVADTAIDVLMGRNKTSWISPDDKLQIEELRNVLGLEVQ